MTKEYLYIISTRKCQCIANFSIYTDQLVSFNSEVFDETFCLGKLSLEDHSTMVVKLTDISRSLKNEFVTSPLLLSIELFLCLKHQHIPNATTITKATHVNHIANQIAVLALVVEEHFEDFWHLLAQQVKSSQSLDDLHVTFKHEGRHSGVEPQHRSRQTKTTSSFTRCLLQIRVMVGTGIKRNTTTTTDKNMIF